MQSSNQPGKISLPFANSGAKQPIPVASQVGIEDGRASYTDGFPPLTRTPLAAGGKPPFGTDMNGVLNAITAIQQWQSAGGTFMYDSVFATSVGGYPKGALVQKADSTGFWRCTVESNQSNPDTGGAGWADLVGQTSRNSGWFKQPDGTIVQYGLAILATTSTSQVVTLPTTFPNAMMKAICSDTGATCWPCGVAQTSTGSITVYASPYSVNTGAFVSKNSSASISWIAFGY